MGTNREQSVWTAPHVGAEAAWVQELYADVVRPAGGLHAVIEVNGGIDDLRIDVFESAEVRAACPMDFDPAQLRAACASAARLISGFVLAEEERLDDAGTGRLIRVVLHAEHGAVLCYSVVPGQFVVGFAFGPATGEKDILLCDAPVVDAADRTMTHLVNALRQRLQLPAQDAGGWADDSALGVPLGVAADQVTSAEPAVNGDRNDPAVGHALLAVHHGDLHFVSRVNGRSPDLIVDCLAHPELRTPIGSITPQARRKFYIDLSAELFHTVVAQGRLVRSTIGSHLVRLVLDVEQGAVYYYYLPSGDYLVGVTLYQRQVNNADRKMSRLAAELPGHRAGVSV